MSMFWTDVKVVMLLCSQRMSKWFWIHCLLLFFLLYVEIFTLYESLTWHHQPMNMSLNDEETTAQEKPFQQEGRNFSTTTKWFLNHLGSIMPCITIFSSQDYYCMLILRIPYILLRVNFIVAMMSLFACLHGL